MVACAWIYFVQALHPQSSSIPEIQELCHCKIDFKVLSVPDISRPIFINDNTTNNNNRKQQQQQLWSTKCLRTLISLYHEERKKRKQKKKKTGDTFPEKIWLGVPEFILFMINNGEHIGVSFLLRNVSYWCQYVQMI